MKLSNQNKIEIIKTAISKINKPNILELGVQKGVSTKMFLDICNRKNGKLTSIDIQDCSRVSKSKRWKFIMSSDDNFDYIKNKIKNNKFDILFIDSLHEPNHVRKVFFYYYAYLKKGGLIFIDDVVWLPYIKNASRDNQFVERINRLTFNKILEIYNTNQNNFSLNINFYKSGLAIIRKMNNKKLNDEKTIINRMGTLKNIVKKYFYAPKPKN
tara:strand:+ start:615 stop:1253 length:639 start_codon:yes stop_codon:yes gene_type:complete